MKSLQAEFRKGSAASCVAVLIPAGAASAEVAQVAADVLSDDRFQKELPPDQEKELMERAISLRELIARFIEWLGLPDGLGDLFVLLLWGGVLLGFTLLVVYLLERLRRMAARRDHDGPLDGTLAAASGFEGLEGSARDRPLDIADRLARDGRYGEAIHVLLLHALESLYGRLGDRIEPALTAREILGRLALDGETRSALARLVAASELDFFGGRPSSAADYTACRLDFDTLSRAREA